MDLLVKSLSDEEKKRIAIEIEKYLMQPNLSLTLLLQLSIIRHDDGFKPVGCFKSFAIFPESVILIEGDLNYGKVKYPGKGKVKLVDPNSEIEHTRDCTFAGEATIKTIDGRLLVTSLIITGLDYTKHKA